nr:retrovirus-related Pol polyprotein from transposon TNT 1-94 [Tanacetum cinerariifolium]
MARRKAFFPGNSEFQQLLHLFGRVAKKAKEGSKGTIEWAKENMEKGWEATKVKVVEGLETATKAMGKNCDAISGDKGVYAPEFNHYWRRTSIPPIKFSIVGKIAMLSVVSVNKKVAHSAINNNDVHQSSRSGARVDLLVHFTFSNLCEKKLALSDKAVLLVISLLASYKHFKEIMLYGNRETLSFDDVKSALLSKQKYDDDVEPESGEGLVARGRSSDRGKGNNEKKPENAAEVAIAKGDSDGDVYLAIDTKKSRDELIVDFGCTFYMIPHRSWFTTYESFNGGNVYMGNHSICHVTRKVILKSRCMTVLLGPLRGENLLLRLEEDYNGESVMYANLDKIFWVEAATTASYLINCSPHRSFDGNILEILWSCNSVDYFNLRVFGCHVYVHVNEGKLLPRAVKCIFLGYCSGVKGYHGWCPNSKYRKIIHSTNVTFNEDVIINSGKDFVPPHNVDNNHTECKVKFEFDVENSTHTQPPFMINILKPKMMATCLQVHKVNLKSSIFWLRIVKGDKSIELQDLRIINVTYWYSSLQAIITFSTTEAEYISSTEGVKEAIWLQGMVNEFGLPQERQFRRIPGDLSPGISLSGDMSPGKHRTEKLEWDTFPGENAGPT